MLRRSCIWVALSGFALFAFFLLASQLQSKAIAKAPGMGALSDNSALLEMASGQAKLLQPQLDLLEPKPQSSGRLFAVSVAVTTVRRDSHVATSLSYCPIYRRPPPATL